jgi:hypothetical protein
MCNQTAARRRPRSSPTPQSLTLTGRWASRKRRTAMPSPEPQRCALKCNGTATTRSSPHECFPISQAKRVRVLDTRSQTR